jgi:hypothetical protein
MLNKKQWLGGKVSYLLLTAGVWVMDFRDNPTHNDVYHQEVTIL